MISPIISGGGRSNYRPDIDGLRAVACLAVVIYHAFPKYLSGGFVGVDIFFVISGYLISSILYRNLFNEENPGKINIIDFYIRRIRRIFPALILVLVTVLVLGWFILLPDEYALLGKHIAGGASYSNNIILYSETGDYFNPDSNLKPLLHLWSLGVEEQFYLVFPVILFMIYKSNINFILSLSTLTVVSFLINRNGVNHGDATKVFYMPWTRFWELSIGSILAFVNNYHGSTVVVVKNYLLNNKIAVIITKCLVRKYSDEAKNNLINNIFSLLGVIVIFWGYLFITNGSSFPGSLALIPVFGALMIIGAGKDSFINKIFLSNRVVVFLGLISYPLYLWHWPLLSLAYICEGETPNRWIRISAVLISLILATMTFLYVEPRLRYGKFSKTKALCLLLVLFFIGGAGYSIFKYEGIKSRFQTPDESAEHKEIVSLMNERHRLCLEKNPGRKSQDNACSLAIESEQKTNVVLLGDSHAGHLEYGLLKYFKNFSVFPVSCQAPLYGFKNAITKDEIGKMRELGSDIKDKEMIKSFEDRNIQVMVLGHHPGCSYGSMIDKFDPNTNKLPVIEQYKVGLVRTLDMAKKYGKKVLFVLDNPSLPFEPNSCRPRPFSFNNRNCSFDRKFYDVNVIYKTYNNAVRNVVKQYENIAAIIDLSTLFCDENNCYGSIDGSVLYRDTTHLNEKGSEYVAPFIYEKIRQLMK